MSNALLYIREVPCPRCHQQCHWCSDYRHLHGSKIPGGPICTVPLIPEGDDCPVCGGTLRVMATTEYVRSA